MTNLTLQLVGAVVIVAAYAAAQLRLFDPYKLPYLLGNLIGAGLLTVAAVLGSDYGFILSNGFWTAISVMGIAKRTRASGATGAAGPRFGGG